MIPFLLAPLALAASPPQVVEDDPMLEEVALEGAGGVTVRVLTYGATVTAVEMPGRDGRVANVVLGYPKASDYPAKNKKNSFGSTIGRYAGRIANARFTLDGREVRLQANDGPNALHGGGLPGPDQQIWRVRQFREGETAAAEFSLTSPDGNQGFPGALSLTVTYRLQPDNALRIDYAARTTKPTVLNLTNHSYFNMAGASSGPVTEQLLLINGTRYSETDGAGIPTGDFPPVAGTPLDFRTPHRIGERIDVKGAPMTARGGYNHSWVLDGEGLREAAVLRDPVSGRRLTVSTTEPSLTVYTGDYIDGQDVDANGHVIQPRDGIALETQHLSDSPNRPRFPSTELRPGETFRSTTVWRFDVVPPRP